MRSVFRVVILIFVLPLLFQIEEIHPNNNSGGINSNAQDSLQVLFAFSDSSGKFLLTIGSECVDRPRELKVVLSNGKTYDLEYVEKRDSKPENTGRLTVSNFNNLGGYLFRLPKNKVEPDHTVVLCSDEFLSTRQPLKIVPADFEPLDSTTSSNIEKARNMGIEKSWELASIGEDKRIALIKFKPKPNLLLASVVLILDDKFVFEDYIGDTDDETSVWRVDDEGEIYPEAFNIPCAFQTGQTIELVRSWAAVEGENIAFVKEVGSTFEIVQEAYRYWAPL